MLLLGVLQLGVHIWLIPTYASWPLFMLLFCHNFQSHFQFALCGLNKNKLRNKIKQNKTKGEVRNECMMQNTDWGKKKYFEYNPPTTNKDHEEPNKSGFHRDPSPAHYNVLSTYPTTSQMSLTPKFRQLFEGLLLNDLIHCLDSLACIELLPKT